MRHSGFTLIELMIVVAIVGVLAAISLPIYFDYIARSQVSEAIASASATKSSIMDFYASNSRFPPVDQFGVDSGRYLGNLTHDANGVIAAQMRGTEPVSPRVRGLTVFMTPECEVNGSIANWVCTVALPTELKFLPSGCQGSPTGVSTANCLP